MPLFDVVARCVTIRSSCVGTRQDMSEALWFAAAGLVAADIEVQPLSAINDVFARLKHGDVPSRVVLDVAGNGASRPAGGTETSAQREHLRPARKAARGVRPT